MLDDYGHLGTLGAIGTIVSKGSAINDEPDQDALFEIDGPDGDGCVWIRSAAGRID